MRTFVFNGMEGTADIEKGDVDSPQHDTSGLSGRKFLHAKGFHLGILGGGSHSVVVSPLVFTDRDQWL